MSGAFGGLRAAAPAFEPPLLHALDCAAAAAGRHAALFPFGVDPAAALLALQLEAELSSMRSALIENMPLAVESQLATAAQASKGAGFSDVETLLYDALIRACSRDGVPLGRITAGHPLGQRLIAAFGLNIAPGSPDEDLYLWSRLLGSCFHVYGGRDPGVDGADPGVRRRRHGPHARTRAYLMRLGLEMPEPVNVGLLGGPPPGLAMPDPADVGQLGPPPGLERPEFVDVGQLRQLRPPPGLEMPAPVDVGQLRQLGPPPGLEMP